MRILLGNNTLDILAGSETWLYTLATELIKRGHSVTAYSPQLGLIATKLSALGVNCVSEIANKRIKAFSPILEEEEGKFDVVICAHYGITHYIHEHLPEVPIIAVCHGIIHQDNETGDIFPEHPVTEFKVDQYISVSEEVQSLLITAYGIESEIIHNFFDLERFKKGEILPETPKVFAVNSNYWGVNDEINTILRDVANHYKARFIGIGNQFAPCFEVEEVLDKADVVIGMGRSVQEGACMGKLAIVHGRWGTGGVITPNNYEELKRCNFSGRGMESGPRPLMDAEMMIKDIDDNFNQKNVDTVYELMKDYHNVVTATDRILEIANSLIKK